MNQLFEEDRIVAREELNNHLWGAADILRGTADAGDYKNHIFDLLFLKRLSDVFDERRNEIIHDWMSKGKSREKAEQIADDPDEYGSGSFFIPPEARWSYLMTVAENRAEAIDTALERIEVQNSRYLEGVLGGARFNDERRFGDPKEMDSIMQRLLHHFDELPLGNRNLAEPDILGNAYEFLIERFAESAGKKGGEFYTPRGVVRLIVELLKPTEGMRIHDPTCGSGGMLIESGQYVGNHGGNVRNVTLTGQERNVGTWAICKLNMLLHDQPDADIRAGDTIRNPKFVETGRLMTFDRVIANPPFSLDAWGADFAAGDPRDRQKPGDPYRRFTRGIPPVSKGDMAFLLHMVEVCREDGMVGVVMPHGVLFRGGSEKVIRRKLLEEDLFEAVIGLPEHLFFGTGIPATVLILNKSKPVDRQGKVLFIDASREGLYSSGASRNHLRLEDILRIVAVYDAYAYPQAVPQAIDDIKHQWLGAAERYRRQQLSRPSNRDGQFTTRIDAETERRIREVNLAAEAIGAWLRDVRPGTRTPLEKFAAVASLTEIIEEHDHNLNISRYVDPLDPTPQLDVQQELSKLRELEARRTEAEARMNSLLREFGYAT